MDGNNDEQQFSGPGMIPPPMSFGQQISEYLANLPQLLSAQQQYDPQFAQLQFDLAKQFFPQYTRLNYDTQRELYPFTTDLQEKTAKYATEGLEEGMPAWARDIYSDQLRAELGTNAGSPIGADYYSRNMLNQMKNWKDDYAKLGYTITNRLPLTQTAQPQFGSSTSGLGSLMNYNQGTYGNYISGLLGGLPYQGGSNYGGNFGGDFMRGFMATFPQFLQGGR